MSIAKISQENLCGDAKMHINKDILNQINNFSHEFGS